MLHKSLIERLVIVSGGPYEDSKGSIFPMHQHTNWELVYYRQGSILSIINGIEYMAHPGVVLLTPPGEAHSDIGKSDYANYFIGLEIEADPGGLSRRVIDDAQHGLRDCCRNIVNELAGQDQRREEMLRVYADQLRILLERAHQRKQYDEGFMVTLHQIVAYMSEHISESIRIQDIADKHHCAVSTMRDWFYKVYDCSPQHYLSRLRFDQARQLIGYSDLKLAAVARTCGFDSISHLSRSIKKRTGMSPGALRKQLHK